MQVRELDGDGRDLVRAAVRGVPDAAADAVGNGREWVWARAFQGHAAVRGRRWPRAALARARALVAHAHAAHALGRPARRRAHWYATPNRLTLLNSQ